MMNGIKHALELLLYKKIEKNNSINFIFNNNLLVKGWFIMKFATVISLFIFQSFSDASHAGLNFEKGSKDIVCEEKNYWNYPFYYYKPCNDIPEITCFGAPAFKKDHIVWDCKAIESWSRREKRMVDHPMGYKMKMTVSKNNKILNVVMIPEYDYPWPIWIIIFCFWIFFFLSFIMVFAKSPKYSI